MYLLLKAVHIFSVAIFLGNIMTGLFWKAHADRTGQASTRAHAIAGIIRSDRWFTGPGVFAIIASGVALAVLGGLPLLRTRWIVVSLVLFGLSGVIFAAAVSPLQRRLLAITKAASEGATWDEGAYLRLSRAWEMWGLAAIALSLAALVLMVLKPVA
jgi:uncharacterized membrane protein